MDDKYAYALDDILSDVLFSELEEGILKDRALKDNITKEFDVLLMLRVLKEQKYVDDRFDWGKTYWKSNDAGYRFYCMGGYTRQYEIYEHGVKTVGLAIKALEVSQKAEAIGRENIKIGTIGLIWIIAGTILALVTMLITLFK